MNKATKETYETVLISVCILSVHKQNLYYVIFKKKINVEEVVLSHKFKIYDFFLDI